jgi:hypothetical protein
MTLRDNNSSKSTIRFVLIGVLIVGWATTVVPRADALIVEEMTGTTVAPANFPVWDNVAMNSRNYIYLGNSWALSAFHVGLPDLESDPFDNPEDADSDDELLHFSTGSFTRIKGQQYTVANPAGSQIAQSSPLADLRLIRLNGDPGLPSIFDPNPLFTIASSQVVEATTNKDVLIIGNGPTRAASQTQWNATVVSGSNPDGTGNDTWTESCGPCAHSGYKSVFPADSTKRWGTNRIADEDALFGASPGDADLRGVVEFVSGAGPRSVMSLVTKFDKQGQGGLTNEAQVVNTDSGSAVFYNRNGNWELLGIVNFAFAPFVNGTSLPIYDTRPNATAAPYGSFTAFADLSFYRNEIMAIINAHQDYSIQGDVNLDGVVGGDGSGPWATDDVTAFVAGWNFQQSLGDITSWKKGDLNLDGTTDEIDFFLLRNALQAVGAGAGISTLGDILGPGFGVPEPSALWLTVLGAGWLAGGRRARRCRAAK